MKFYQPSHELWYPTEPLKDIERAARISYASEGKITETSAKPLVDKLFTREHMTPFEFVTFGFKIIDINVINRLLYFNQLSDVQGDLMISYDITKYAYLSANLRTIINFCKYDTLLAESIVDTNEDLISYFNKYNIDFNDTSFTQLIKSINNDDLPLDLQYQTVKFITNRGVSHELVRHRKAAFVQSSTRYIGYEKEQFNGELPIVINEGFIREFNKSIGERNIYFDYESTLNHCQFGYNDFRKKGMSPQEARAILPNDTMTEIVMIAKHWEWKNVFKLRTASGAHPDMIRLMTPCYNEFKSKWPEYYD